MGRAEPRVGWFELFYDLVLVAAVAHGGHLLVSDQNAALGLWLALTFVIAFVLWLATSLSINIRPGDLPGRRTLMFIQMIAITVANLSIGRSDGLADTWGFIGLAVAFATVSLIYFLVGRRKQDLVPVVRPWSWSAGSAAVLFALGSLLPDGSGWIATLVLVTGVLVAIVPLALVGVPRLCRMRLINTEHLDERLGQFVIIVLGESFLGLVLVLDGLDAVPGPVFFVVALVVAGALWAIYFTTVYPRGVPRTAVRFEVWLVGLLLFVIGAAYSASMHASYAAENWQSLETQHPFAPLPSAYALLGALMLGLLAGDQRDWDFARIHVTALVVLGIAWATLLLLDVRSGNLLLLVASGVVIADALACLAQRRALASDSGNDAPAVTD